MKHHYLSPKMYVNLALVFFALIAATTDVAALQFSVQNAPELEGALKPYAVIAPTPGHPYTMSGEMFSQSFNITMDFNEDGVSDWDSRAYCVDLYGFNDYGSVYDGMIEPVGNYANMDYVAWLMDSFSTGINNGFSQPFGEIWEAEVALQLAIWNVVYNLYIDGNTAGFGDTFSFTGPTENTESLVDLYLSALTDLVETGGSPLDSLHYEYAVITPLVNGNYSGQKLISTVESTEPVPEPATLVLMGCGLLGLTGVFRKRLKKEMGTGELLCN